MSDRNEGDIGFIPRSQVIAHMRANWQDPVGFHEAMAAHLHIEESDYAPHDGTLRGRLDALKDELAGVDPNEEIEGDVLARAIRLAQTIGLSGDEALIGEATPWFEANNLPTPRARAADAS